MRAQLAGLQAPKAADLKRPKDGPSSAQVNTVTEGICSRGLGRHVEGRSGVRKSGMV